MTQLMTLPDAAKLIGITRQAAHKAVVRGRIKAERIGQEFVVTEAEVQRFIKKRSKVLRRAGPRSKR